MRCVPEGTHCGIQHLGNHFVTQAQKVPSVILQVAIGQRYYTTKTHAMRCPTALFWRSLARTLSSQLHDCYNWEEEGASSFACPTQSSVSPGMPCCPRKRLSWAACSWTWRRVYNWSSKKLIGFHHLQGKATWRWACSSDNESSVVWH